MSKKNPQKKHKTNPQNAQKSTGPVTEAGKAVSSQNAAKHNLFSQRSLLPHESAEQYQGFYNGMMADLKPVGEHETFYARQYIHLMWRFERGHEYDAQLWRIEDISERTKQLDRFSKAMTRVENQMSRMHRKLQDLQAARRKKEDAQNHSGRDDYARIYAEREQNRRQQAEAQTPAETAPAAQSAPDMASFCKNTLEGSNKPAKSLSLSGFVTPNGGNGASKSS